MNSERFEELLDKLHEGTYEHIDITDAIDLLEKLDKDRKRIDWLADKNQCIGNVELPTKVVINNVHSLRDAIDEAMEL